MAACKSDDRPVGLMCCCLFSVEIGRTYSRAKRLGTYVMVSRANGPAGLLGWTSSRWPHSPSLDLAHMPLNCRVNGPGPSSIWAVRMDLYHDTLMS